MRAIAMAALQGIGFCFNKYHVTNSPLSLAALFLYSVPKRITRYVSSVHIREFRDKKRGAEKNGKSRIGEPTTTIAKSIRIIRLKVCTAW